MEQWAEALEHVRTCLDELESAVHLGNKQRMAECRKWANEAMAHERQAYQEAMGITLPSTRKRKQS